MLCYETTTTSTTERGSVTWEYYVLRDGEPLAAAHSQQHAGLPRDPGGRGRVLLPKRRRVVPAEVHHRVPRVLLRFQPALPPGVVPDVRGPALVNGAKHPRVASFFFFARFARLAARRGVRHFEVQPPAHRRAVQVQRVLRVATRVQVRQKPARGDGRGLFVGREDRLRFQAGLVRRVRRVCSAFVARVFVRREQRMAGANETFVVAADSVSFAETADAPMTSPCASKTWPDAT